MSLPNSGMTFTPFDTLPASDLNDLVENIESLSDGSGFSNTTLDTIDDAWTTYTPTFTGWSSTPTYKARYKQVGKNVTVSIFVSAGTSNSTSATISTPVSTSTNAFSYGAAITNADGSFGCVRVEPSIDGPNVIRIYSGISSPFTNWVASGPNKTMRFTLTYEAA